MKFYHVVKIFDRQSRQEYSDVKMCGQAAWAHVPTKKFIKMLASGSEEKKFQDWIENAEFEDLWLSQKTLDPIIGQPVYFISVKLDAGSFRTSPIEKVEVVDRGFKLTTANSVYLIKEKE
jgi:hypothetical protein